MGEYGFKQRFYRQPPDETVGEMQPRKYGVTPGALQTD
jgi:hypothetical protein